MTPPRLSTLLKQHNAGYVLVRPPGQRYRTRQGERVATGKEPALGGWQKQPVALTEALNWARRGGNVGLLGGTGDLILLDADANADRIEAIEPRLRQTVRIVRGNAPDRRKWIVRIDGDLPASQKAHGKLEILSTGTQGVIFGRHHSGVAVEHVGDQIITLTTDDIRRIWQAVVGSDMAHQAHQASAAPDTESVQRAMAHVDVVLQHGALDRSDWRPYDGGVRATLQHCPFNPADNPHPDDEAAAVIVYADGHIGATCHHARCQERIHQAGSSGWQLLKQIAGVASAAHHNPDQERARVAALREFVRRTDFADHVPVLLQSANGYRTRDTDVLAADAILDIAHEVGRTSNLLISLRALRQRCNFGSLQTAANALARLSGWFVVEEPQPDAKPGDARRYAIHPALIAWAEEEIRFCVDRTPDLPSGIDLYDTYRSEGCTIYANSILVTQRTRDAFASALRPITAEELDERVAQREAEIAAGADVRPIDRRRYRRRLAASAPGAGRTVLRLIDALADAGGAAPRQQLIMMLNLSAPSLSRAVKRAAELGLVSADRRIVRLHEDWRDILDAVEPLMPSAGRRVDREVADADAAIRYAQHRLRVEIAPNSQRRWQRSIQRAVRRKRDLAALQRPDLAHRHADTPAPDWRTWQLRQKFAEMHAQARVELSTQAHADAWRLQSEIRRLRSDGLAKRDAWRMLEMAGWPRRELYGAMEALWPRQAA
mgnify:CR=1 FL=1